MALSRPSMISFELAGTAMILLRRHYHWERPLRSIGIRGVDLVPLETTRQLSLFGDEERRERKERLEYAIDNIRGHFGHNSIGRAIFATDDKLGKLDAKTEHIIHPVGYM